MQDLLGDSFGGPPIANTMKTDLFELTLSTKPPAPVPSAAAAAVGTLLDDLAGAGAGALVDNKLSVASGGEQSLTNGSAAHSLPQQKPQHSIPSMTAFDKSGVKVVLGFVREPASDAIRLSTLITAQVSNSSATPIEQFVLQAAVPKQFQLQMLAPSGLQLPANSVDALTQPMRIVSPPQVLKCSIM